MNKEVLTALSCLWLVLFAGIIVYTFPAPRQWVLRALALKEMSRSNAAGAVVALQAIQNGSVTSTDQGMSLSSSSSDTSGGAVTTTSTTTYQYKLLESVDTCSLNRLGAQGWHTLQFGGTLVSSYGYDETCKKGGIYDTLDWVLLERVVIPG